VIQIQSTEAPYNTAKDTEVSVSLYFLLCIYRINCKNCHHFTEHLTVKSRILEWSVFVCIWHRERAFCKLCKPCHKYATCRNTAGSYKCRYKQGYQGNGEMQKDRHRNVTEYGTTGIFVLYGVLRNTCNSWRNCLVFTHTLSWIFAVCTCTVALYLNFVVDCYSKGVRLRCQKQGREKNETEN